MGVAVGVGGGMYSEQKSKDRLTCGMSVLEFCTYFNSSGMQPSIPVLFMRSVSMLSLSFPNVAGIRPVSLLPDRSK